MILTLTVAILSIAVTLLAVWCAGIVRRLDDMEFDTYLGAAVRHAAERHGTVTVDFTGIDANYHPENES